MSEQTAEERQVNNVEVMLPQVHAETGELIAISRSSPMDMPVQVFTEALNRREANRRALLQWIQTSLVQGVDYGSIHIVGKNKCRYAKEGRAWECPVKSHWSKNSLFKPGAEKILGMMSLTARYPNIHLYEEAVINGQDIQVIILKCELHTQNGIVVGEGTGARSVSQDYGDINKSIKMASKSAMIDATLRVAGLSELFTQDLETMIEEKPEEPSSHPMEASTGRTPAGNNNDHPANPNPTNENDNRRITADLYRRIVRLSKEKGMSTQDVRKWCVDTYGVVPDHLRVSQALHLIEELTSL